MGNLHLIRHDQASFGADDYAVPTPIGICQADVLNTRLRARPRGSPGLLAHLELSKAPELIPHR